MPGYYEPQPQQIHDTAVIRSVGRCILLLIASFGLWGFAWMYHTTKEVSSKVVSPPPSAGLRTFLYVVPIAQYVVWAYSWRDIENYCKRTGSKDFPMVLFFVLTLLLGIPGLYTFPAVQSRMNDAHRAATNGQATDAKMQTIDWVFVGIGLVFWAFWVLIILLSVVLASS